MGTISNLSELTFATFMMKLTGSTNDRYYGGNSLGMDFAVVAAAANTLRAYAYINPHQMSLDRIAVEVTTAGAAGTTARMAIYADNGSASPGNLYTGTDVGTVATDTTGVKINTISPTVGISPGILWMAFNTDGTASFRRTVNQGIIPVLGLPNSLGDVSSYYSVALTYGPMPSTFTAGATIVTTDMAAIYFRMA